MVKIEKQVVWGRGATVGIKEVKTESRAGDVHCVTFHLGRKVQDLIQAGRGRNNFSVQLNHILISKACSSSLLCHWDLSLWLQKQRADS